VSALHRTLPFALVLLAGCPADDDAHQLWIAPNGSEASLKLVDHEPDPF
jgi:hypothetical protein